MSERYKNRYLPVEVIIAATQGEAAAIQTVLKTYESYIRNKCIKTVYDERGLVYYGIDTDKKDFIASVDKYCYNSIDCKLKLTY